MLTSLFMKTQLNQSQFRNWNPLNSCALSIIQLCVDFPRSSTETKLSLYSFSQHSHNITQHVLPGEVWTDLTDRKSAGKSAVLPHQQRHAGVWGITCPPASPGHIH